MLALTGQAVEADQRELDLRMAAVAALLARPAPEGFAHVLDIPLQDVEQAAPAGGEVVGDAALEQVAEVVELVVVAEVGPALVGLALEVPAVQITVRRLGPLEIVDDGLDLRLYSLVASVRERVGGGLDPFADVGVPEHLDGEVVLVAREAQRRRRVGELQRVEDSVLGKLDVLAGDGPGQDGLEAFAPEIALEMDIDETDRLKLAHPFLLHTSNRTTAAPPASRAGDGRRWHDRRRSSRAAVRPPRARARAGSCRCWSAAAGRRAPSRPSCRNRRWRRRGARRGPARAGRRPRRGRSGRCRRTARPAPRRRRRRGG